MPPIDEKRPLKIFLCHSSADKARVREVYKFLQQQGFQPWLDAEDLLPGQDWNLEISKALDDSDAIIIFLSRGSVSKEGYVQKEIKFALDRALEMPEGRIFIIPARLDDCDLPRGLKQYQWVNLYEEGGAEKLLKALKVRVEQLQDVEVTFSKAGDVPSLKFSTEMGKDAPVKPASNKRKLDTTIVVALIGVFGTIVAALLGSPLIDRLLPVEVSITQTPALPIVTNTIPVEIPSLSLTATATFPAVNETSTTSSTQISILESFPAPGTLAEGIAWDGEYLWLPDNSGSIFKLNSSGKVLGNYSSPEITPQGMTWDGSSFWVFTTNHFFIFQFQIIGNDTKTITSFRSPARVAGGGLSQDMAWDGDGLWYANEFNVFKLDTSGTVLNSFAFPKKVDGLDWDGSNLWMAFNDFPNNATMSVADPANGEIIDSFPSLVYEVIGLAWADDYLWVLGRDALGGAPLIYKVKVARK